MTAANRHRPRPGAAAGRTPGRAAARAAAVDRGRELRAGRLLQDNGAWDSVGDLLTDADFYRHEHRLIYGAIGGSW
jgi:hypothetical protein